ncbi:hypothetical protein O6H91_01G135200 [Diphasiastrum complanatum]|uniref:Uncharacterized protein n=1 Tax=Diphasiastrum complanatum TaxID=34168 RepID=A0ACC2EWK0_DIPCM|nr:hypothetical protein O6H91_01G135200 [Diphasiastrum complanatum]
MRKIPVIWRRIKNYVRNDLREIAFPSSLPDPPSSKPKPRKLTIWEHLQVWKTATKLYVQSWSGRFDDDDNEQELKENQNKTNEPSMLEDLAVAARGGAESLKPALQRLYVSRATAYRDALKEFVGGYQEGIAEVLAASKNMKLDSQTGVIHDAKSEPLE